MGIELNRVYQEDCIDGLARLENESVDLAFADPPFNIGYEYDVYEDRQTSQDYLQWSRQWMDAIWRALKPNGAFWLAIGDEYAAELKLIAQDIGFSSRSWVIWYYTFGVNCVRAFSRSHTHLFHFVKDPYDFTFNAENPAVRVPSARQLVYADRRANPRGRLPDNTWILRPQDVPGGFAPEQDTWYFPRVAGTFKEREGFHGCQMPEQLLGRIVRCCSNPLDVVLDPFGGSGTTLAVAKKLGRRWIGFELSKEYVKRIRGRLREAKVGDPLDGAADPTSSAPSTNGMNGKGRKRSSPNGRNGASQRKRATRQTLTNDVKKGVVSAFQATHEGYSVDRLLTDPQLDRAFLAACKKSGLPGNPVDWNRFLLRIRKSGEFPRAEKSSRVFTFRQMDPYSHGSEIAMRCLAVNAGKTFDEVLCDPRLAKMFDDIAGQYAPGYSSFEYRWAALAIRKRARRAWKLAEQRYRAWLKERLPRRRSVSGNWSNYAHAGVYIVSAAKNVLYVGETFDVRDRVERLRENPTWQNIEPTSIVPIPTDDSPFALQAILIRRTEPVLNAVECLQPASRKAV